jgi:hypothetical protein
MNRKIEEAWGFLEHHVSELTLEARSRQSERPVLQGAAMPGNAWEDYAPAVTQSNLILKPEGFRIILSTLRKTADEFYSEEKAFRVLDSLRPQFEALRRGARRSCGDFVRDWDSLEAGAFGMPPDQTGKPLVFAALLQSHRLLRAGKGDEALELFLATLQLGWDMGRNGTIVNEVLRMEVFKAVGDELARQIQDGKFTSEQLVVLDRSLQVLDAKAMEPTAALRNHLLMQGEMILHNSVSRISSLTGRGGPDARSIRPTWRYLYSTKLLRATAFRSVDQACEQFAKANAVGYSDIRRVLKEVRAEFERSHNLFADVMLNDYDALFGTQRRWIAQLRLVRTLARYRATGEVLSLDDPLERILRHQLTGSKLSIWMDGPEGKELLFELER